MPPDIKAVKEKLRIICWEIKRLQLIKKRLGNKIYKLENPEKVRLTDYNRKKRWQANNPDKVKEMNTRWRNKNRDKARESDKLKKRKQRAKQHLTNNQ